MKFKLLFRLKIKYAKIFKNAFNKKNIFTINNYLLNKFCNLCEDLFIIDQ